MVLNPVGLLETEYLAERGYGERLMKRLVFC